MLQTDSPKTILLISGGISGMIQEIFKYKTVKRIDYLEINPQIIKMALTYTSLPEDHRIHIVYDDARRFIRNTQNRYDVVIFALPDPMNLQINRLYTNEFIILLKEKLNKNAVILYNLSPTENYMSYEKIIIASALYNSLKKYFKNVVIIPGEKDYYISSDKILSSNIGELVLKRNIQSKYVNSYYIDDLSQHQREAYIKTSIQNRDFENKDQQPITVFYLMLQFINRFNHNVWFFVLIPALILLLPLFFMKPVAVGMYITGITSVSIELLLIFLFQIIYGNVYSAIGLIIAVFMAGLALGGYISQHILYLKRKHFLIMHILLVLYTILIPFFWILQKYLINDSVILIVFLIATLIPSAIIGFQYAVFTSVYTGETTRKASLMYAYDLMGSAFGIVLVTIVLLPLIGMNNCFYILAGLNVISIILNLLRK
jgi:spermidine synthase